MENKSSMVTLNLVNDGALSGLRVKGQFTHYIFFLPSLSQYFQIYLYSHCSGCDIRIQLHYNYPVQSLVTGRGFFIISD